MLRWLSNPLTTFNHYVEHPAEQI